MLGSESWFFPAFAVSTHITLVFLGILDHAQSLNGLGEASLLAGPDSSSGGVVSLLFPCPPVLLSSKRLRCSKNQRRAQRQFLTHTISIVVSKASAWDGKVMRQTVVRLPFDRVIQTETRQK